MAITNKQILRKIMIECEQGLRNERHVREHAKAIQSLTDLLLEQDVEEEVASPSTIQDLEWNKMVGESKQHQTPSVNQSKKLDETDANGDSLLDF